MKLMAQPSETDALWIERASTGDLEAFNQLVLAHQDMAYHHAQALLGDPALAEDATQESFIKAFQAIHQFRGGSFRGWLLKIVTNTAYDFLRRSSKRPSQALFPEDEYGDERETAAWLADPAASVQAAVEQRELSDELHRLLSRLPESHRNVILLVDVHELDYAEAARALGVPIGTVKSRLARARMQMQKQLKDEAGAGRRIAEPAGCLAV